MPAIGWELNIIGEKPTDPDCGNDFFIFEKQYSY